MLLSYWFSTIQLKSREEMTALIMNLFKASSETALIAQKPVTFAELHAILQKISENEGKPLFTHHAHEQPAAEEAQADEEPAVEEEETKAEPEAVQENFTEEITETVAEETHVEVAAEGEENQEAAEEVQATAEQQEQTD